LGPVRAVVVGRRIARRDTQVVLSPVESGGGGVVERLVATAPDVEDQAYVDGIAIAVAPLVPTGGCHQGESKERGEKAHASLHISSVLGKEHPTGARRPTIVVGESLGP